MIDIHAHILPGVDDGAGELSDSLELAELSLEGGVDILAATPHSNQEGRFENYYTEELVNRLFAFREALAREKLPLTVLIGMEIYASQDVRKKIEDGRLIGLNGTGYFLVEFPFDEEPEAIGNCLEEISSAGKIPLIAHPERYFCVQEYPALVYEWLQMGCFTQVNKGSLFGKFGSHAKKLADLMLSHHLVTCVASDAHSPYSRTTFMGDVRGFLEEEYGEDAAYRLLTENPEKILRGLKIRPHGRMPEKKRRFFW